MTFYTGIFILTQLMMITMGLHVLHYSGFTKSQKTWFLLTFSSIMICSVAEFAVHCGYYSPGWAIPLTVLTVIQFSVAPILAVLFSGALGLDHQKENTIIFAVISFLVETVSAPFGLIFYFDENGYSRGKYFFIYGLLYFISLIYLILSMIFVGRKFRHRDSITIIMVIVILVAGIIPMTLYQLHVTYLAVAIAALICYVYYNDLVQQDIQAELLVNQNKVSTMQSHIISSLSNLIENRDTETGEHVLRTGVFVEKLARFALKDGVYANVIDEEFIARMQMLAPMHDIGKIVVSDKILRKPGRLTESEYEEIKKHAKAGGEIVREVLNGVTDENYMSFASDLATYHHERWDGAGYPEGLSGEDIPLSARIMAIADVYDALVSERCYKMPVPPEEAVLIIKEDAGRHFDPLLVEVFLRHKDEFTAI